jgi:drug/metabolite transporter (DMT)-like permease
MAPHTALSDRRSVFLMLLSVVLFSANTLIIRGISAHVPAADGWLASLFRGICGLIVVAALFGFGRGFDPKRLIGSRLVMIRGIVGAIGILAFYVTVTKLGAARAVVLNLTYPAFATIIAAFWLKETITRAAMLWMVVAFVGLLLFLGGEGQLLHPSPYDLLGLFGAAAAGWVVVVIRRLRHEEHPATIYASQAFYGMLASTPAVTKLPGLPGVAWGALIAAAVLVCFAQLLMTRAYQTLPVSRGSAMQMTLPLVTAVGGFAFFHETFHLPELAGAALTLLATWRVVASK